MYLMEWNATRCGTFRDKELSASVAQRFGMMPRTKSPRFCSGNFIGLGTRQLHNAAQTLGRGRTRESSASFMAPTLYAGMLLIAFRFLVTGSPQAPQIKRRHFSSQPGQQ